MWIKKVTKTVVALFRIEMNPVELYSEKDCKKGKVRSNWENHVN